MMNHRVFAFVSGAVALLTCLGLQSNSSAAPTTDVPGNITTVPAAPTVQRLIKVKNVAPEVLAWWLDPTHNDQPAQLIDPLTEFRKTSVEAKTKSPFALPTGVQSVNPIKPQNAILVLGTEAGIAELQKTLDFLDVPLRQVEIEATFILIDEKGAKDLGVELITDPAGKLSIGFVRGNWQQKLTTALMAKQAKVMTAGRVTAANNMTARLTSSETRQVALGFKDEAGKFHELNFSTPKEPAQGLLLDTSLQLTVTPTINNDNTITLLMAPQRLVQLSNGNSNQQLRWPSETGQTIASVRDGDTVAIQGLSPQAFLNGEEGQKTTQKVLVLVTPRIVRRAGDDQAKLVSLQR